MTIGGLNLDGNGLFELFVNDSQSIYVMSQGSVGVWDQDWYDLGIPSVWAQGGYAAAVGWRRLELFAWGQTPGNVPMPNATLWRIPQRVIDKIKPSGVYPIPKPLLYWDRADWEQVDPNAFPGKPARFIDGGLHLYREHDGQLDVIAAGADRKVYSNWQT
jgi:hypothetical protein